MFAICRHADAAIVPVFQVMLPPHTARPAQAAMPCDAYAHFVRLLPVDVYARYFSYACHFAAALPYSAHARCHAEQQRLHDV